MKLCINALSTGGKSGVRNYFNIIATLLPRSYPQDSFLYIVNDEIADDVDQSLDNVEVVVYNSVSTTKKMWIEQTHIPRIARNRNVDIIYTMSIFDIFLTKTPTVIRIGNMLPYEWWIVKRHKHFKTIARLYILKALTRLMITSSSATLAMSEPAAEILKNKYPTLKRKIHGIYRGVDTAPLYERQSETIELPDQYILVYSHMQEHKNLETVITGYALLAREIDAPPLVFVGGTSNKKYTAVIKSMIFQEQIEKKVIFTGQLPRGLVSTLIIKSVCVIFPSLVETMPVTLVEEMMCGGAIIACRSGVIPSIAGDSVLYYEPDDSSELHKALYRCSTDEKLRRQLSERAISRTEEIGFSWDKAIHKRMLLFKMVAGTDE